jgi:galactose-1-phosphate uridylyltransferase
MAEITFEHRTDMVEILNPLKGFALERQELELRWDPLLRHSSLYNPGIEEGIKSFIGEADRTQLERLAAESAGRCFFCPERIEATARFPETFIAGGRLKVGEATLFANLFALAPYHAVIAVSHAHWLPPGGFTPPLVRDAIEAAWQYLVTVSHADPAAAYATLNANYLFPAGASILHPHFQVLASHAPYTHQERLLQACQAYLNEKGSAYHADLIAAERRAGERYIGPTGDWHWLASYSPLAANEIIGIHTGDGDFTALSKADLDDLAGGLAVVLACYGHLGYYAFNFTLYSRRRPAAPDGFHCLIRCMTRQNPSPNYRTDDYFLQKGLESELILTRPERLAAEARVFFEAG